MGVIQEKGQLIRTRIDSEMFYHVCKDSSCGTYVPVFHTVLENVYILFEPYSLFSL